MTVNGKGPEFAIIDPGAQACVELLEQVLVQAKRGMVTSCVVVACGPEQFGAAFAGPDAAKMNLGLDTAKQHLLAAATTPQTPAKKPTILRAHPVGG